MESYTLEPKQNTFDSSCLFPDSETPDCEAYAGDQMVEGKETAVMCRYGCTGHYRPTLNWYNLNTSQPITTDIYNEGPCSIRGLAG